MSDGSEGLADRVVALGRVQCALASDVGVTSRLLDLALTADEFRLSKRPSLSESRVVWFRASSGVRGVVSPLLLSKWEEPHFKGELNPRVMRSNVLLNRLSPIRLTWLRGGGLESLAGV